MIINISIPMKPFSVNAYHYKSMHKTSEARAWEVAVLKHVDRYQMELEEMFKAFDAYGGTFVVTIDCFWPKEVFYNKAGLVSAKTMDCSNVEKPLIDLVFLKGLKVDDRYITRLVSSKHAAISGGNMINFKLEFNANSDA